MGVVRIGPPIYCQYLLAIENNGAVKGFVYESLKCLLNNGFKLFLVEVTVEGAECEFKPIVKLGSSKRLQPQRFGIKTRSQTLTHIINSYSLLPQKRNNIN
jgi:hypothetical protein